MHNPIEVVVVDDHVIVREGVIRLLSENSHIKVVSEGSAGNHVMELVAKHRPDVLLTDLQMPAQEGEPAHILFEPIASLQEVIQAYPETAVVVLSQEHDVYTIQALAQVGVKGYLLKTDEFTKILGRAIEIIHYGATYFSPEVEEIIRAAPRLKLKRELTARQLEIVQSIVHYPELTRDALAQRLHISTSTLQKHINAIFDTLEVPNMESCILKVLRTGLITLATPPEPIT